MNTARDRTMLLGDLEREGQLLGAAARSAGPRAVLPTCPGWSMRDLVLHVGEVHRWATIVVRDGLAKPSAVPHDHLGPLPDDDHLLDWFSAGHAALVATLRAADEELAAFRFLADSPPAATFWARRQAHETEIHRVDAESAVGTRSPLDPGSAADGIDELLTGFVPRANMRLRSEPGCSLAVALTDQPGAWHVAISNDPAVTTRGEASADCTVRGSAEAVYLALWNRSGTDQLSIDGDPGVLARFRELVQITWN